MSGFIEMDWNDWVEEYKPISKSVRQPDRFSWESDDYSLETYGLEVECVRFMLCFFTDHVWTYTDDGEDGFISNGYHLVNRLNYYITEKPALPNVEYEII